MTKKRVTLYSIIAAALFSVDVALYVIGVTA